MFTGLDGRPLRQRRAHRRLAQAPEKDDLRRARYIELVSDGLRPRSGPA